MRPSIPVTMPLCTSRFCSSARMWPRRSGGDCGEQCRIERDVSAQPARFDVPAAHENIGVDEPAGPRIATLAASLPERRLAACSFQVRSPRALPWATKPAQLPFQAVPEIWPQPVPSGGSRPASSQACARPGSQRTRERRALRSRSRASWEPPICQFVRSTTAALTSPGSVALSMVADSTRTAC